MAGKQKPPKPLNKSNSPVSKTGQGSTLKKRLLKAKEEDLIKGREKILMAARTCFARQGFAGTSMRDIQLAADCSRGNLYHHFKAKEEIVQIITAQNLGRFCDRIEAILKESDERDLTLLEIIEELASFAEEITKGPGKGIAFHVWSLSMVEPEVRKTMLICFERIRNGLEQKIILLMKKGKLKKDKNTEQLSVALFGLVIPGFTVQSVFMDEKAINSTQYAKSLNLLFKSSS
ncbi:TetR/AcrR family transcriptional regulator [Polynucleobacter sp. MG-28-Ekke-A2]|uniref:TetR/AcrR family transcriptional regulator n=1 Tax=Polynucleobacter sp. MG-28-Ekke-A2 TaxID=3108276 RepID=UPI002B2367DC|nr:TetR/AcrR family transcriptional regulator [Polynucleobacter sp. MG-28-Ekke-A2]MEA9602775.1 TetR/AcrR family transcriptional regulator [Polynucleobacter sp. MG-28-Ekke-A2]